MEQGSTELLHEYVANTWHNLRAFPKRLLFTISSGAEVSTSKMPTMCLSALSTLSSCIIAKTQFYLQFLLLNLRKSSKSTNVNFQIYFSFLLLVVGTKINMYAKFPQTRFISANYKMNRRILKLLFRSGKRCISSPWCELWNETGNRPRRRTERIRFNMSSIAACTERLLSVERSLALKPLWR